MLASNPAGAANVLMRRSAAVLAPLCSVEHANGGTMANDKQLIPGAFYWVIPKAESNAADD